MILCADIGGSFIDFAAVRPGGKLEHRTAVPTPVNDLTAFVDALVELCRPWPEVPLHIAIAGVENPETGIVHAANIPCLKQASLGEFLQAKANRRVLIANDADCFALAEARFGVAKGHQNVFGIILGTGIGGGHILSGKIVTGLGGITGEWGHSPTVLPPPFMNCEPDHSNIVPLFKCGCGQAGCLDTIAGARALERLHLWAGGDVSDSRSILTAWEGGDLQAERTMAVYLSYVSAALAHVVNITGCTIIPVGGGLGNSKSLIAAIDRAVREKILYPTEAPLLIPATLGTEAGLLGAACLTDV